MSVRLGSSLSIALLVGLWSGCGPSTRDDGTTADSGSGGDSTDTIGIVNANDDGPCRELVPCETFNVEITGDCLSSAYMWSEHDCVRVTGCECMGPDCCHLTATYDECLAAMEATCEDLSFCPTCEPGTSCFALCDHVGTVLDQWCQATTEDCGPTCVCEEAGYGISTCQGAHPRASACIIP